MGAFGFELTGVDIAEEFIEEAKRDSRERALDIDWRKGDMRDLPWSNEFDGAFCFGNSFGYLDDGQNADFLEALSRTLKPGARVILDAPAIAECLLPNFQEKRTIEIGGIKVTIDNRYDHQQSRIFPSFTFVRNGIEDKRSSSQRIYTYKELSGLLSKAGLGIVSAYSSLDENPFKLGAHRLLLVAMKG